MFWGASWARSLPIASASPLCLKTVPAPAATWVLKWRRRRGPMATPSYSSAPALAISPHLYKQLNYDPVKDLAPISLGCRDFQRAVRPFISSGQESRGTGRARESQSRQTQLRLGRYRLVAAYRRRNVQEPRQGQYRARAVQGRHPGDDRDDRRRSRHGGHRHPDVPAADPGRQGSGARGAERAALTGTSRRADGQGGRHRSL